MKLESEIENERENDAMEKKAGRKLLTDTAGGRTRLSGVAGNGGIAGKKRNKKGKREDERRNGRERAKGLAPGKTLARLHRLYRYTVLQRWGQSVDDTALELYRRVCLLLTEFCDPLFTER